MFEKEFEPIISEFRGILKNHNHNWDINQLHAYFPLDQSWSLAAVKKLWDDFLRLKTQEDIVDLYMHIPFCRSKCSYCPFKSWLYKNKQGVDGYLDFLIEEMHFFKKTFHGVRFQRLLVGGGTPNILSKQQLSRLFSCLFDHFGFSSGARKTFECNPETAREAPLGLLKELGFTKLNLGVQSLNHKSLKINKRGYQSYEKVKKAVLSAKKMGFRHISVDLIFGLAGDTMADFAKTFAQIAKLKPAEIVVHGLKPPNAEYLSSLLKMSGEKYFLHHYPKIRDDAFKIIGSLSKKFGYVHAPGGPDPTRWQWGFSHKDYLDLAATDRVYTGELTGCSSILGLGINARSHISRKAEYRRVKQPRRLSPDEKIFEGRLLTRQEEMIKFVLNHLDRNSNIPRKPFKQLFGADITGFFPHALTALRYLGKIRSATGDVITFGFQKPEEKYIYALFFLREAKVV